MAALVCKACNEVIEGKALKVLEGAEKNPAYFHGLGCWNRYKAKEESYVPDSFIPEIVRRKI